MTKIKKLLALTLSIFLVASVLSSPSYAGNNDSLPSYGYSGKGDDRWKYNSNYSAMRISFYWAPDEDAFNSGENVIQIGKTTDVSKTGPWYHVDLYTGRSIYWYMNQGNIDLGRKYKSIPSDIIPYDWAGYGDSPDIQSIVSKMPDVWTGTKAQWDNWFEGPIDPVTNELGYENIPDIAKLCGAEITIEDFKNGIFTEREFRSEPGIYK
ncbi:MAG: hypothetical protein GX227_05135, partial [Clostridiaceae bacterium]|nr:hypothetical protein [Clostridiaceae bacterium]